MSEHGEVGPSKEKLIVEVPLSNRIAHLGIDISDVYPKVNAQNIATAIDIDGTLVRRFLKQFEIESEVIFNEKQKAHFEYYPHYSIDFVREEREWREWYRTLPSRIPTKQIAEAVGRSYGWTLNTLKEIYPDVTPQETGLKPRIYPREAVKTLREITFSTPPDEDWYTIPDLVEFTGRDREWVLSRIAATTIKPELRWQVVSGRKFFHYPPDTLDVLREAMEHRPEPAGDWLTARAIEVILHKSRRWVSDQLKDSYASLGEPRLDDNSVERVHYPPSILDDLRTAISLLEKHEHAGDWLSFSGVSVKLGVHAVTLSRLMNGIELETDMRFDALGKLRLHYSPQTQERLAAKALETFGYPEADGWITFRVVMQIIRRPEPWILNQLKERNAIAQTRLAKSRQPNLHYDPAIIAEIKAYSDSLDPGDMVSAKDIARMTNQSLSWVVSRLANLNIPSEKRFSKSNRLVDHYPRSIISHMV